MSESTQRFHTFLERLNALTVETGVALGICPGCEELKLYDLKHGVTVAYQVEFVDHLFVDISDLPCVDYVKLSEHPRRGWRPPRA